MHNISEMRRREKINEKMKALQELILRCNKSDKASMLDDAIEYVKSLQMRLQMMSMGGGVMPMMYTPNMQQFMPHMAMGMMGMNRPPFIPFPGTPFPRQAHIAGQGPSYPAPRYPFPNIQASDPSIIHLPPSQQPNPMLNQPQFSGYMNSYGQFVDLQQMQQPPPFHVIFFAVSIVLIPLFLQMVARNQRIKKTNQQQVSKNQGMALAFLAR